MTDMTLLIAQAAAVSCADTLVLETRVANQSLLKFRLCKAIQVDHSGHSAFNSSGRSTKPQ